MQFFPKVHSPCPYKGALSEIMDGDVCRLCQREVHDFTGMAEDAKRALFESCTGEICVTYRIDARPALAALAIGAGVMAPTALAAQDAELAAASEEVSLGEGSDERIMIIVGGARRTEADWRSAEDIREAHQKRPLPVVYDDESASRSELPGEAPGESPKRT